ncbi:unnamed protein product [Linum tenue]|uniref:Methyltransferase type 11 domain-containing protein n=1 Tax=Linum tenue TaxID=586396 RepID=A0AAV0N876_9ROSI|nr:unnamed protein product [Linum tenue]
MLRPWQPPSPLPTAIAHNNTPPRLKFPRASASTTNASEEDDNRSQPGKIRRQVLTQQGRGKLDLRSDRDFYSYPRFVTHVDGGFISALTELYRRRLQSGSEVLDLMSSWVSHLPEEMEFKRVVGHGLNAQELAKNPRLDYFFVKDLNRDQKLELSSSSFDAVLCTVSVQYLQYPEQVFAEVFRALRPGGVFIVSFSNRMFYEKAITSWRDGSDYSRVQLVVQYFQSVVGFTGAEVVRKSPGGRKGGEGERPWYMGLLELLSGSSKDPFYAVIAYKNFKPVYE